MSENHAGLVVSMVSDAVTAGFVTEESRGADVAERGCSVAATRLHFS